MTTPTNKLLYLTCDICSVKYENPDSFLEMQREKSSGIFFRWSLKYCDKCRKIKEFEALKRMPEIINILNSAL